MLRLSGDNRISTILEDERSPNEPPRWSNCSLRSESQDLDVWWTLSCPFGTLLKESGGIASNVGPSFYTISSKATVGTLFLGAGGFSPRQT